MTLIEAVCRVYPSADIHNGDFGTNGDKLTNWNEAKLGPRPNEADVMAAAANAPETAAQAHLRKCQQARNIIKANLSTMPAWGKALAYLLLTEE